MKRVLLTLLAVAAFVTASVFWESHVRGHVAKLIKTVDEAIDAINNDNDFKKCSQYLFEFDEQWDHVHDSWALLIAHKRLTDIEASLVQAKWASQEKDRGETLSHLGIMKLDLMHLSAYYSLSWPNLF